MNISDLKQALTGLAAVNFRLPDGTYLPAHFHVTEVGLVRRHFVDCGGVERREAVANFQLWEAGDYDHRLAPQKFLRILQLAGPILESDDLEIEVEYQQATIGKFGLAFDGTDFRLTPKQTACLAQDACGIPSAAFALPQLQVAGCAPGGGCC
ncbi:DUF6428 family protein [Hymenobacter caeli]|uniref:Uncharacterized protein n=1 Tax=Hymenobacter caeli TaxID=2735894 RepID=A0ABX2FU20_9BACT|nr:DUF6428 family protein [Hymenobacter caeli]NRT20624.1 hypothetical protein [Hymenobacter caeli]